MRVYVSVDMEGIAGIARGEQVLRGQDDFERSRRLMTAEASAAVAGSFDAGAVRVVVNDSHGDMTNLLADELDPRAELTLGSPKVPYAMVHGIDAGFDVALFVGYHAGPGTADAVLDHTYSGRAFWDVRLNGETVTEAELNAAVLGARGIPLGLVTGDSATAAVVEKRLPGVRTAVVKQSAGRHVATSLSPASAQAVIREAAAAAVDDARRGVLEPFVVPGPVEVAVDTRTTLVAELCALVPGSVRSAPRTVSFAARDIDEGLRCLVAWLYLGASAP